MPPQWHLLTRVLEDQQSIANKLAGEAKKESQPEPQSEEVKQTKIDSTRPVR